MCSKYKMKQYHASFIILLAAVGSAFAYDEYSSACMRPGGRTSKAWTEPPCDFKNQGWCTSPGSAYPWHAVRRFVQENQGLMRRMYGEMRQISVLRAEYESNDVLYPGDGADFQLIRDGITKRYRPTVTESSSAQSSRRPSPSNRPIRSTTTTSTSTTTSTTARTTTTSTAPTTTTTSTSTTTTNSPIPSTEVTELLTEDTTEGSTTSVTADTTAVPTEGDVTTTEEEEDDDENDELELVDQVAEESETEYDEEEVAEETAGPNEALNKQQQPQLLKRGINACPVKEEVVAPFWANNTRGEWLALLNLYPFEQYVHWEKCTDENQQMFCRDGCRCEQQYRLHRLLAYDPRNECRGIFSDWFKFPSCCICKCYDIEFRLTSRSPRRGTGKSKKVKTKTKVQLAKEADAAEVPINGLEEHDGEIRADLQAVVHHADPPPHYRIGARKFPEAATMGPIDAATPHFYYQPLVSSPLSRRPREVK
ncbi:hypothetical protein B566_EDAN006654 [Ephemera danica]|nr:hypothetical protein B566_EDAN006654 [Ephemera danica]